MSFTAVQGQDIVVDLLEYANYTGWAIDGTTAVHSSCVSGKLTFIGRGIVEGTSYTISFEVVSISGGYLQGFIGGVGSSHITSPGIYRATFTAMSGGDGNSYFFSDANCVLTNFVLQINPSPISQFQTNTIAYSQKTNKWVSFYTLVPDIGCSLFTKLFTTNQGTLYIHESGAAERNEFYGTQYQSVIQFVDNTAPTVPKTFQSLSIQSNELLITTEDGIETSLGQLSELSDVDFIKDYLTDGVSSVNVQAVEGVYSANFLRDKNSPNGLLNGDSLKGNYLLVTLISTSNMALNFYTVNVVSSYSPIGSR